MSSELPKTIRGCPFCDGKPVVKVGYNLNQKPVSYTIYCPHCKLSFFSSSSLKYAVRRWSRRYMTGKLHAIDYVART